MAELTTLVILTTLLVYFGAGVFPYLVPFSAGALSLIGIVLFNRQKASSIPLQTAAGVLLVFFILFTIIPIPFNSSLIFGKTRAQHHQHADDALQQCKETGLINDTHKSFSFSRNRAGSIRALLLWITGIWTVVFASRLSDDRKRQFLMFAGSICFFIAVSGIAGQWIFPQGKTLWWIYPASHGEPVACFINRNHYAGFLALLCPALLCMTSQSIAEKRMIPSIYWAIAFIFTAIAIFLSMSRGAWIAAGFSLSITLILLAFKHGNRTRILTGVILFILFTAAFAIPSQQLRERAESMKKPIATSSAEMRFRVWQDALRISRDYALIGTGPNGFRMVFPQYRTDTMRKEFKHVENEYVQTFVEYGAIGGTIILIALITLLMPSIKSLRHPEKLNTVQISAIAGCSAAAAHSFLDFSLRIPLYFVVFLILLLFTSDKKRKTIGSPLNIPIWTFGAVSLVLVTIVSLTGYRSPELDMPDCIKAADSQKLAKCLRWSPTSWHTWFHLGSVTMSSRLPASYELGIDFLHKAIEYDPHNYRLVEQLCRVQIQMNDIPAALKTYKRLKELRDWKKIKELDRIIQEQDNAVEDIQ